LDRLEKQLPFSVIRVTAGSLTEATLASKMSKTGNPYIKARVPAYLDSGGMWARQCTRDFKVYPVTRAIRRLMRARATASAVQWIGISWDEVQRVRDARQNFLTNFYPLIDRRMRRSDCLKWMEARGFPKPPRSACVYCPYHHDREWLRLQKEEPEAFAAAVEYEKQLQAVSAQCDAQKGETAGKPFLHSSCKPLDRALFDANRQTDLFINECEGMCGV
jgi:hypothetical protein